jgi:hypothetical protein
MPGYRREFTFRFDRLTAFGKCKCKFKCRFGRLKAFGTLARWGGASGYSST